MDTSVALREKRKETLITISFSVFSILMIYMTATLQWPPILIPIIAIEVAYAWYAYINQIRNHLFRAIILSSMTAFNIFTYGMQGADFFVLIPTLCTYAVMISLYEMMPVFNIVVLNIISLFLYHLFIKKTFDLNTATLDKDRMILHLLSLVVVILLLVYRIFRHQEEEDEIRKLETKVEQTQKIKDDFVANTSHELRTPINTITGMSEILLQENLPDKIHEDVLDIQMTGFELQNIVTDILDYAALEAKTLELNPRSYNITSTINDILNMTVFQNREKNLELIFDCDPRIPRLLYGDEGQLRRVINNLIGNAIKFTNEGGVRVEVTSRPETYGANLIVRVKDTGIGMDLSQQERVFNSFYQADTDRNRRVEGMGLGLTISSELIKKMGGFMYVTSKVGEGSEFSFSIPQKVMDDRPCIEVNNANKIKVLWYYGTNENTVEIRDDFVDHINHISEYLKIMIHRCTSLNEFKRRIKQNIFTHLIIGTKEYYEDQVLFDNLAAEMPVILVVDREENISINNNIHVLYKPYNAMTLAEFFNGGDILHSPKKYLELERFVAPNAKILVVDDNLMNLKVVEGLLRKYRIKITAASSGEEALKIIDSREFDFVFMDHMMPGMDGIECLHAIRAKQGNYYQKVPIIALTANAIAGSREMFLAEGFNDFVAKPIDNTVLDAVLRKYIPLEKQIADKQGNVNKGVIDNDDIFAQMKGIDRDTALTYCGGSISDYIDLASIYYETGLKYHDDLIKYYEEKDWKNYSILTHSIKSTSKTIGALDLSELAYKEEVASKQEDINTINEYHEALLNEYTRVLEMIGNNPKIIKQEETTEEDAEDSKDMSLKKFKEFMTELKGRIETFETSSIKEVVEKYKHFKYQDKKLEEIISPIIEKIEDFDFEGAKENLEKIVDGLKDRKVK